ncbi:MAG: ribosomal L7Ae/L30e/S12e/Gadd45 family protein [Bacillota bacterium]|jgi:large subunit ribosomal protein L7A
MALPLLKDVKDKIVGLKQTLRALQQGKVQLVYIANDVDESVMRKITETCNLAGVPLVKVNCNQYEVGRICQIEVGAAVVAVPK